jgi:hypothetical protein
MLYVANTFSLNMLKEMDTTLKVSEVDTLTVKSLLQSRSWESCVGHQGTADILKSLLDMEIPMNRVAVKMEKGDLAIVFQLMQRVEEGKVLSKEELQTLPHKFLIVEVVW